MENSDSVKIYIGRTSVTCSKRTLINNSDYFKVMFSGGYTESERNEIRLKELDPSVFKTIVKYYSGESLGLHRRNVNVVLKTAAMLQFGNAVAECEDFIIKSFTLSNCFSLHAVSDFYGTPLLRNAAFSYALWNFPKYIDRMELLQLSFDEFARYLGNENLNASVIEERKLVEIIFNYLNANEVSLEQIRTLIKLVHYSRMRCLDVSCMLNHPMFKSDEPCLNFLTAIIDMKETNMLNPKESSPVYLEARMLLMKPSRKVEYMPCVVGAKCVPDRVTGIYTNQYVLYKYNYDTSSGKYEESLVQEVMSMQRAIDDSCVGFSVAAVGSRFYITGGKFGIRSNSWNNKVWVYDTTIRKLNCVISMRRSRRHHRSLVLNGILFLVDGLGSFREKVTSIDAFNILTGQWLECNKPRSNLCGGAPCCHFGQMYVFVDNEICIYNPVFDSWSYSNLQLKPAVSFRHAFSSGIFIYLIEKFSPNVYIYSPTADRIRQYGLFRNETINVCQVESKLFCFTDDIDTNSQVIEIMDLKTVVYDIELLNVRTGENKTEVAIPAKNLVKSEIVWRRSQINGRKFVNTNEHFCGSFPLHAPY